MKTLGIKVELDKVNAEKGLDELTKEYRSLRTELNAVSKEININGDYINGNGTKMDTLTAIISNQEAKLAELHNRYEALDTSTSQGRIAQERLAASIKTTEANIASYQSQLQRTQDQIDLSKSKAVELRHEYENQINGMNSLIDIQKANGNQLTAQREKMIALADSMTTLRQLEESESQNLTRMSDKRKELTQEYKTQSDYVQIAKDVFGEESDAAQRAEGKLAQLKNQVRDSNQEFSNQQVRLNEVRANIAKTGESYVQLKDNIGNASQSDVEFTDRVSEDIRSLSTLNESYSKLKSSLNAVSDEVKLNSNNLDAQSDRIRIINDLISNQESKLTGLRNAYAETNSATQTGREQQQYLSTEIQKTQSNIENYTSQLRKANNEQQLATSGVEDLRKQYENQKAQVNSLVGIQKAEGNQLTSQRAKMIGIQQAYGSTQKLEQVEAQQLQVLTQRRNETSQSLQQSIQLMNQQKAIFGEASSQYRNARSNVISFQAALKDDNQALSDQQVKLNKVRADLVKSETEYKKLSSSIGNMSANATRRYDQMTQAADKMTTSGRKWMYMAENMSSATLTLGYSLYSGLKTATQLQNTYKETSNLLVAGGESVANTQKGVNQMMQDGETYSIKYGVSMKNISAGYQDLIKRGYSTGAALGSMKAELQAAKASGDDFNDVVTVSSQVIDAFGLRTSNTAKMASNTSKVTNELAYAADMTASSFKDEGVAMSYVSSTAHAAGISLAETSSAIGELSNAGIEGSKAGTGLRKVITELTGKADELRSKYGIVTTDAQGHLLSLSKIFQQFHDKVAGWSTDQKTNLFKAIFGETGMNAAQTLSNDYQALGKLTDKVSEAGEKETYVQKIADKNMSSAKNQMAVFKQSLTAVNYEFASSLLPYITKATTGLAKMMEQASKMPKWQKATIAWGAAIVALAAPAALIVGSFQYLGSAIYRAGAGIQKFSARLLGGNTESIESTNKLTASQQEYNNTLKETDELLADEKSESAATNGIGATGPTTKTAATSSSKWDFLGKSIGTRIINGAGLAISAWDVGTDISQAVNSKSSKAKYSGAAKTAGSLIGGGIGLAVGGPFGAILGQQLGQYLGSQKLAASLVKKFAKSWNASINGTTFKAPKVSTKSAYNSILKAQKNYISQREKNDLHMVNVLHKTGNMSDAEYKKQIATIKSTAQNSKTIADKSGKDQILIAKNYANQKQKIENQYAKQRTSISKKYDSEIQHAENEYGKNSVIAQKLIAKCKEAIGEAYSKKKKQLSSLNTKYAKNDMTQEAKESQTLTGKIQKSANDQQKILSNLNKNKKKMTSQQLENAVQASQKEYTETKKYANQEYKARMQAADKTYNATIKAATRQENETISAANRQYKETVAAAKKQYSGNSSYAESQRKALIQKAKDQRSQVVNNAFDQYNKTKKHAEDQYNSVQTSAEKQRKSVIDKASNQHDKVTSAAESQRKITTQKQQQQQSDVTEAASNQSKGVLQHETKQANGSMKAQSTQGKGTVSIWSKLASWWNKLAKDFGVETLSTGKSDFSYTPLALPAYANGSGPITHAQTALVGEAGPELAYKPYSNQVRILGTSGAQFAKLEAGELVLSAKDTAKLANGNFSGTLPGYANGTSSIASFISAVNSGASSIWNNITDSAITVLDDIADPVKYLTNLAKKTFNLTSTPHVGTVAQEFSEGLVNKTIQAIGNVVEKLAKSVKSFSAAGTIPTSEHAALMKAAGIPSTWYNGINWIVNVESGWNPRATNKSSGAYGLPQSLPARKMASAGSDYKTNAITQLKWMYSYVKDRYGSAAKAVAFHKAKGWYANGGVVDQEGTYGLAEGNKAEMVLPLTNNSRTIQLMYDALDYMSGNNSFNKSSSSSNSVNETKLFSEIESLTKAIAGLASKPTQVNINGKSFVTATKDLINSSLYEQSANEKRYGHA